MYAVLAQLVEQPPCKRQVVGAEPTHGSICLLMPVWAFFLTSCYFIILLFYVCRDVIFYHNGRGRGFVRVDDGDGEKDAEK